MIFLSFFGLSIDYDVNFW